MAFSPKKQFGTDKNLEVEGVWVPLGDGAKVKVARWNNPTHKALIEKLRRPFRSLMMSGRELPDDKAEQITIESMVEAILLDWEGFVDENDNPLPFSKAASKQLLTEVKDFRDLISGLSVSGETFRKQEVEDIAKNS